MCEFNEIMKEKNKIACQINLSCAHLMTSLVSEYGLFVNDINNLRNNFLKKAYHFYLSDKFCLDISSYIMDFIL